MKLSVAIIFTVSLLAYDSILAVQSSAESEVNQKREAEKFVFRCYWKICSRPLKNRHSHVTTTTTTALPEEAEEPQMDIYDVLIRKFIKNYSPYGYKVDGIDSINNLI